MINESEWGDKFKIRYNGRNEKGQILIRVKNLSKPELPEFLSSIKKKFYLHDRIHALRMAKLRFLVEIVEQPAPQKDQSDTLYFLGPGYNPLIPWKLTF